MLFALSTEADCEQESQRKFLSNRPYCADEIDRLYVVTSMLAEPKDRLTLADGLALWDWCKRNFLKFCLLSQIK